MYGLPEQDFIPHTLEQRLVLLIDGMVEFDRPTTLEQRFASNSSRYKDNKVFLQGFRTAGEVSRSFLDRINSEFSISPERIAARSLSEFCLS